MRHVGGLGGRRILGGGSRPTFTHLARLTGLFFSVPIIAVAFVSRRARCLGSIRKLNKMYAAAHRITVYGCAILSSRMFIITSLAGSDHFDRGPLIARSPCLHFCTKTPVVVCRSGGACHLNSFYLVSVGPRSSFSGGRTRLLTRFTVVTTSTLRLRSGRQITGRTGRVGSSFLTGVDRRVHAPVGNVVNVMRVLDRASLDRRRRRCISGVGISGRRLLTVVGNVLSLSGIRSNGVAVSAVPVGLSALYGRMIDLFTVGTHRHNLVLSCRCARSLSPCIRNSQSCQ